MKHTASTPNTIWAIVPWMLMQQEDTATVATTRSADHCKQWHCGQKPYHRDKTLKPFQYLKQHYVFLSPSDLSFLTLSVI